ncbi:hypothetical protein ACJMK2_007842 [Sinanodonta woodiana]|uniref:CIDE-N domain-containing protein n=1 Tax=Sinanodonta woodiana TaxID=1069815 RepID=A0ABD3VJR7_SINWO
MATGPRPYKIWNHDRSLKKSVTASNLEELIAKGKEKLGIPASEYVRVALDEDGTEVDEEDYFTFLPFNSTVILLMEGQTWRPEGSEHGTDEPDFMTSDGRQVSDRVRMLTTGLNKDMSRLITFSNEDLQELTEMKAQDLAQMLLDTEEYAKAVQEACRRFLDERQQTSEAMELLCLYHKARECSPYVNDEGEGNKRQKFSQT